MPLIPIDYNPFEGPKIQKLCPLSESQLEIWLSCAVGGDDANRAYNESVSISLHGTLHIDALQKALLEVIKRHEALRATISGDGMQMCIYDTVPFQLEFQDIRVFDEIYQKAFIAQYAHAQASRVYDLQNGPLFRVALFQLGTAEHVLVFNIHHIIGDGWSLGIILRDISTIYSAFAAGKAMVSPDAPSFAAYNLYVNAYKNTESFRLTEQYWIDKFARNVPVLSIPTDFPRPQIRTYKSNRKDFHVPVETISALRILGAKAGCSFATTLTAVFEVFIQQLSQQQEIIIGLPAAGQSKEGLERLVGHCVNLLPLLSDYKPNSTFSEYLKFRKGQFLSDYEHQSYTFGTLIQKLNLQREAGRIPLVPVVLNIDLGLDNDVAFEGLKHELLYNPREFESFEIFLNISGKGDSIHFEWSYNTQLFKLERIEQMMDALLSTICRFVNEPKITIREITGISLEQAKQLAIARNNTKAAFPKEKSLPRLLQEVAKASGNKTAVIFGKQEYSYSQLEHESNALATYLQRAGIRQGHIVGLAVPRGIEMLVCLLAIMKTGAAYLPIDVQYPKARIQYMLDDSQAELLITTNECAKLFQNEKRTITIENVWPQLSGLDNIQPIITTLPTDLAYLLYTSGSTGQPKGVMIEHHSLVNLLWSMAQKPGMNSSDKLLSVTTISFDIAGLEMYLPLLVGGTLVLADTEMTKDGRLLLECLQKQNISIIQATPATFRMLIDSGWNTPLPIKVLCGGEAMPLNLARQILTLCDQVWNVYGPTETTIWSLIHQVKVTDNVIPIGLPINNTAVFILDEALQEVEEGEVGEIYIGGEGLARGYFNQAETTSLKFINSPIPEKQTGLLYRTGDLGKSDNDGNIICLGRTDVQIKMRGYRIEPGEIETALIQLGGIKEAVVLALHERLLAYITGNKSFQTQWKQQLQEVLPSWMIPHDFIILDKLPLTPNGKVDRLAIAAMAQDKSGVAHFYVPAVTPSQVLVAKIWQEVLGIEQISIQSNFFELGGHSLLAIKIMASIEKQTGLRLPLSTLFEAPTIQKLAAVLNSEQEVLSDDCLVPMKPQGTKPALYIVHGYDLNVISFNSVAQSMDAYQPVFGLQAMGLSGKKNPYTTMEEIAAHYIAEILDNNPNGPYAIAGYSFGGVIAFEMTRQLESMGKTVIMLALLDSYAENADYFYPKTIKWAKKISRQFPKMWFIAKSFFQDPKRTIKYQLEYIERRRNEFATKLGLSKSSNADEISQKINAAYESAYRNYKMQKYNGQLDVFRVKTRLYYLADREFLGWLPFAKKGVKVHEINGDHKTFLMPPRDKAFATTLQEVLNERAKEFGY